MPACAPTTSPIPLRRDEIGYFVPPDPARMFDPRPNRPQVIQSCDCYVDKDGVMYLTDSNAGLYILQFEGGVTSAPAR